MSDPVCSYCFGPLATGRNTLDKQGRAYCCPEHQKADRGALPGGGLPDGGAGPGCRWLPAVLQPDNDAERRDDDRQAAGQQEADRAEGGSGLIAEGRPCAAARSRIVAR